MNKTKPIGVRFDESLILHLKQTYKIETHQHALNFLSDFYFDTINDTASFWFFYKLVNPIDNSIFYVGRTKRPIRFRLSGHISEATNKATHHLDKSLIIRDILKAGLKPLIILIEKIKINSTDDELKIAQREYYWIEQYSKQGAKLANESPLKFPKPAKKHKGAPKSDDLAQEVKYAPASETGYDIPKIDREAVLKQIADIRAEKIPKERDTVMGRKSWQIDQNKRIVELQKLLNQ